MATFTADIENNIETLKRLCGEGDEIHVSRCVLDGVTLCFLCAENMTDAEVYRDIVTSVTSACSRLWMPDEQVLRKGITNGLCAAQENEFCPQAEQLITKLYSGYIGIFADGIEGAFAASAQGFKTRSISHPTTEENITGGKEGFVESARTNQTMLRRRIKSPQLRFETLSVGKISKTSCVLTYLDGIASPALIDKLRRRLQNSGVDIVTDDGAIKLALCDRTWSLYPDIGRTERPDTVCAKLYAGRAAVIVDGTPFVLIAPYVFTDFFESVDDYTSKTSYSNFLRICRYLAYFLSMILPGFYVAAVAIHPEIMPRALLLTVAVAKQAVPFNLMPEMLLLLVIYEIMREAGLRLPKEIGHAVSIVGALVIGETAAAAGIIGTPTILVAAVAVISAFLVPALSESCVILRFLLVFLGGTMGFFGLVMGLTIVLAMLCRSGVYGPPISSGIAPTDRKTFFTAFLKSKRQSFSSPDTEKVGQLPGSDNGKLYEK